VPDAGRAPRSHRRPLSAQTGFLTDDYFVYILASRKHGTLHVGVTNDLARRVFEHREGLIKGFTYKYDVKRLVYFELHDDILEAIRREKLIKRWRRDWKIELVERDNPDWRDLYPNLTA
jgi:putative endonuclease